MDRYANLEVGFLLQRLEQSGALVILASNLNENLDKASTGQFHYIIHFLRPERSERERIWRLASPKAPSPAISTWRRRIGENGSWPDVKIGDDLHNRTGN
jgi:SpoVK/Ycf46/Vps4 family AAA+-type ATPase